MHKLILVYNRGMPLILKYYKFLTSIFIFSTTLIFSAVTANQDEIEAAEILHGERLFQEARFSQYFYHFIQRGGKYNETIDIGDPILEKTHRFFGLPPYQIPFATSAFKGSSFSCRTCHMVEEHVSQKELGMRAYADFASRSPLSARSDQQAVTVRNSPILVASFIDQQAQLFHADGEFSSLQELIIATFTQRNFGWLADEEELASAHICNVIKQDDGTDKLAKRFGGLSYKEVLSGTDNNGDVLAAEYLIDKKFRINVSNNSCNKIIVAISRLLEVYIIDLQFSKDDSALSPYDTFLRINNLPLTADENEPNQEYSKRLLSLILLLEENNDLKFVENNINTDDGKFLFHDQLYKFGHMELQGLKVFFNQANKLKVSNGNCVACHAAPHFTDFKFHNVGVSQVEYEALHGLNSFNRLPVPSLAARIQNANTYLPATSLHPKRRGVFRQAATQADPLHTDLGAWNILFNDDFPAPQHKLYEIICDNMVDCASKDMALQLALATFKTPTLRNLGHSAPYMHNGQIGDLHSLIGFYMNISNNSRTGSIRNADEELTKVTIAPNDIQPLVEFLISLYEDYN